MEHALDYLGHAFGVWLWLTPLITKEWSRGHFAERR